MTDGALMMRGRAAAETQAGRPRVLRRMGAEGGLQRTAATSTMTTEERAETAVGIGDIGTGTGKSIIGHSETAVHRDLMSAPVKATCSIGTGETQTMAGSDRVFAGPCDDGMAPLYLAKKVNTV